MACNRNVASRENLHSRVGLPQAPRLAGGGLRADRLNSAYQAYLGETGYHQSSHVHLSQKAIVALKFSSFYLRQCSRPDRPVLTWLGFFDAVLRAHCPLNLTCIIKYHSTTERHHSRRCGVPDPPNRTSPSSESGPSGLNPIWKRAAIRL